jgi:mono/diheme cytochrome c family protein
MKIIHITGRIFFLSWISMIIIGCSGKNTSPSRQEIRSDSSITKDSVALPANYDLTYEQRQGKYLYTKYCAVCHGEEGKGDGFNAFNLDPKPRDFTDAKYMSGLSDEHIIQTVRDGGRSVNRSSLMPSWGGRIKKEEIRFVLSYIRMFASPRAQ